MKSIEDFDTPKAYWEYVHTYCTLNTVCVLLSQPKWTDYKAIAREADRVATEVVKVLSK